jgi:hypothetical protein
MLPLLLATDGGTALVVPAGSSSWNGFQVLGLTPTTAAVRELTQADEEGAGEACENPAMGVLVKGRTATELPHAVLGDPSTLGVTLHTWNLPPPGTTALAKGSHAQVYRSGGQLGGCTTPAEATRALTQMKAVIADAGIDLQQPPPAHVDVLTEVEGSHFSGECFIFGKKTQGCSLKRTVPLAGAALSLVLAQKARSDCVRREGDVDTLGCQTTRTYSGTVEYRGERARFELLAPAHGDNATFWLESAVAWSTAETTVTVFNFAWCYVSCRERTPVIVRVR